MPSSDVLDRIRNLTLDLQAVQNELCRELARPDGTPKNNSMTPGLHSDLGVLRTAVDQFRRALWYYVDQTGKTMDSDGQHLPQAQQLQQKTAAPAAAKLQGGERRPAQSQPPASFFDRLELVVEGYLQPGKSLAAFRKTPES